MNNLTARTESLLDVCAMATPGEWVAYFASTKSESADIVSKVDTCDRIAATCPQHEPGREIDNAGAIAQMHNEAPALLREWQVRVASASAVIQGFLNEIPPCSCNPAFTDRGLDDPSCYRCYFADQVDAAEQWLQEGE